ncbi:MAG TPA: DNA polymerase III subunit delta' [Rhodospirillales bacterium]|nr:DNA polymerase III subunit delta' [Rhodospirillales bacterium]
MNGENIDDEGLAPVDNPDLSGHDEAEATLKQAFESDRLAHAWLLSGPQGIGKATLAYRFARYVLAQGGAVAGGGLFGDALDLGDETRDSLYIGPEHPVFRRVASGGHSDLKVVVRTVNEKTGKLRSEIVVDDIRSVGNFFHHTAGEGGWRVVVVDCADEMNPSAANALLKVLEEPPPRGLLLLVSHNSGRLLPTIRSRCRKLALHPLPEENVASLINAHRPDLDAGDLSVLAHLADGSPGRALALAEEGGLGLYRDMIGLLETLPRLDVGALHAFGGKLGKTGAEEAFHTASGLLQWWLARLILITAGAASSGPRQGKDPLDVGEEALMKRLGQAASLDRWFEVWEKINRLLVKTDLINLSRKQVVLNVFLTLQNAVRP